MISVYIFSCNWFQISASFCHFSLLVLSVKTQNTWQLSWRYECKDSRMSSYTLCEDCKKKQAVEEEKKKYIDFWQYFKYRSLWYAERSSDSTLDQPRTGKYNGFDFTELLKTRSCYWNPIRSQCHFGKCPKKINKMLGDLKKLESFLRLISDTLLIFLSHYLKPDRRWVMSSFALSLCLALTLAVLHWNPLIKWSLNQNWCLRAEK